jgi:hypothetical protein
VNKDESFWSSASIGAIGGLVVAIMTLSFQYFVGYKLIEKPKQDAEAQTRLNQLIPVLETSCNGTAVDAWKWYVVCTTKNKGNNPSSVTIDSVSLVVEERVPSRPVYRDGRGFHIAFEDERNQYLSIPTSSDQLGFYVLFDRKAYPEGIRRDDLAVELTMNYQTPSSISGGIQDAFDLTDDDIKSRDHNGRIVEVNLPEWKPNVQPVAAAATPVDSPPTADAGAQDTNNTSTLR